MFIWSDHWNFFFPIHAAGVHDWVFTSILSAVAYREHRRGEETPREKLQEDDDHSMVNTGLTDSLRLRKDGDRDTHTSRHVSRSQEQSCDISFMKDFDLHSKSSSNEYLFLCAGRLNTIMMVLIIYFHFWYDAD